MREHPVPRHPIRDRFKDAIDFQTFKSFIHGYLGH